MSNDFSKRIKQLVFKNDCPTQKVFAKLVSFDKSIISKVVNFCIFQV